VSADRSTSSPTSSLSPQVGGAVPLDEAIAMIDDVRPP
jgi:hypothetical protein